MNPEPDSEPPPRCISRPPTHHPSANLPRPAGLLDLRVLSQQAREAVPSGRDPRLDRIPAGNVALTPPSPARPNSALFCSPTSTATTRVPSPLVLPTLRYPHWTLLTPTPRHRLPPSSIPCSDVPSIRLSYRHRYHVHTSHLAICSVPTSRALDTPADLFRQVRKEWRSPHSWGGGHSSKRNHSASACPHTHT